jgi:hypothetical protein
MKQRVIAALAVTVLFACERENAVTARADFCEQLVEFQEALAQVPRMESTTQVADLRRGWQRVQEEYHDLADDARQLNEARARDLKRASDNLQRAINQIPPNATVAEAATMLRGPAAEFEAASQQMRASVQCPSTPTGQQ